MSIISLWCPLVREHRTQTLFMYGFFEYLKNPTCAEAEASESQFSENSL